MVTPYNVVPRSELHSHYGCYSNEVRPRPIPHDIAQRAFAFEAEVKGKLDSYQIKLTITREDAQAIFVQTGLEIGFVPGQAQIERFLLGEGAFGKFCIARVVRKVHYVGIKITLGRDDLERAAQEREAQTQLALSGLPCIMPTLDLCKANDPTGVPALCQVMELGGLGSTAKLKKHLDFIVDQPFKQQVLFCLAEGLLTGLTSMHRKGYYHLDMKPDNLVVRQDGQVFLIDFGCTVQSDAPMFDTSQAVGDLTYFSSERGGVCDATKIDAWAAGITLLILGGFAPLPTAKTFDAADRARQAFEAQAKDLRPPSGNSFLALVYGLLHPDPAKRLSPAQAMQHTWFLEMQKASAEWREDTVAYLRELVQSLHRESRSGIGPQDLPLPHFAAYIERTALKDSLQKILLSPSTYERASVTVCQGMGGVGKTQFVTHLIHQRRVQQHFGLKLWFRGSDSRSQLETQIVLLARELRLVDDKASFEQAQPCLHQHLVSQSKPWLIVFDNADDPDMLTPFLPKSGGHILVTTRSTAWPGAIPIDLFSPNEAVALVEKLLQKEEPRAQELCQELGFLPLGIVQACAFIRNQRLTVAVYLEQLKKDAALVEKDERLFGKKLPNSMLSLWQATFQVLAPEAMALLDVLAYLAPENIPPVLMQKLGSPEARATLKQYALLQENAQGFCSIHRLVQLAARSKQQPVPALVKGMTALFDSYAMTPNSQEMFTNAQLITHGEAILAYAEQQVITYFELGAPLLRTYFWLSRQHGVIGHPSEKRALLEKALYLSRQMLEENNPDLASVLNSVGEAWREFGDAQKALQYYEQALAIFKKVYGEQHPDVAVSLNDMGKSYRALGDAQKALQYHEQALAIFKKVYGEQHPSIAAALNSIGDTWGTLGDAQKALQHHEQALVIYKKMYGEQHPSVATSLNNIGAAWRTLGDAQKALQHHEQALAIYKKMYGEQHPLVATSLNNMGTAWKELGDSQKALQHFEQALAIYKKVYGEQHPEVAISLNNIGVAWKELGNAQNALQHYEQALAIKKKVYGEQHPDVAQSLNNIGSAWHELGDAQKALQHYEQALAIDKKVYGEQHPRVAQSLNNMGQTWLVLGDAQKALQHFEQALTFHKKVYGEQHSSVAISFNSIGFAWAVLGDAQKALQHYEQAFAIYKKVYSEQHPYVANLLNCIGSVYHKLGDRSRAIHYCNAAYQMALLLPSMGPDHPNTKRYKRWSDAASKPAAEGKQPSHAASSKPKKKKCLVM